MLKTQILKWDSNFFGYGIASIVVTDSIVGLFDELEKFKNTGIKLVYIYSLPRFHKILEGHLNSNFKLVDKKITFIKNIKTNKDIDNKIDSYSSNKLSDQILSLALQSGAYSRFKIDSNFQNHEFERLYTEWIKKSIFRKNSFEVLVYEVSNTDAGFITLGNKGNRGDIGLVAVDKKFRGKSIGSKLIKAAENKFIDNGYKLVQVVTQQNNESACNFYKNNGFVEDKIDYVYHFWM